ncbi:MAG: hypothetical protein KGL39_04005 [Patescibacteria group bacterium]|nr:hypothetical protein [Patescibacteria group bacterium]
MFKSEIRERMTAERAYRIRELRVTEGYSWRALASQSADDWGDDATWEPKSNQLAGMALCEIAAASMGEDYMQEPWN